jgi:hypothetical protein
MIKYQEIIEGNLKAEKCTDDFRGVNKWNLYVMTLQGFWLNIREMEQFEIQKFFKTKLPIYNVMTKKIKKEEQ